MSVSALMPRSDEAIQVQRVSFRQAEGVRGRRGKKNAVGCEQLGAVVLDKLRLQQAGTKNVDAGEQDGALAAGDGGLQLERRARHCHAGKLRDARIERLREAAARAAHFEIRLPRERAHRGRHVAHRRSIDEVHAVSQRHAERDAGDGERHAPARAARTEQDQQPEHRLTILRG